MPLQQKIHLFFREIEVSSYILLGIISILLSFSISFVLNNFNLAIEYYPEEVFVLNWYIWPILAIITVIFAFYHLFTRGRLKNSIIFILFYNTGFSLSLIAWYNLYQNFTRLINFPRGIDVPIWISGFIISLCVGLIFTDNLIKTFKGLEIHTFLAGFLVSYNVLIYSYLVFIGRQTGIGPLEKFNIAVGIILPLFIGLFTLLIAKLIKTRKVLQESEYLYRFLFENAPIGIGTSDFEGNVINSNSGIAEILGYTLDELKEVDLKETFVNPETRSKSLKRLIKEKKIKNLEVVRKRKDGSICYTLTNLEVIERGGKNLILNSTIDISARKTMEEKLRKNEEQLELALWGAEEGMWDWDLVNNTVTYGPVWYALFGYDLSDLDGDINLWQELIHPEHRERIENVVQEFIKGEKEIYEAEYRLKTKSGKYTWIHDRGKVVERDKYGNPIRAVGTSQNVTERKKIEIAKEEAKKQRKRFVQVVSHELRTPLTAIKGVVDFLERIGTEKIDEEKTVLIRIVNNSLNRLERLVHDLLDISRIDRKVFDFDKQVINICDFLKEEIIGHKSILEDQIEIDLCNEEEIYIDMDKERIGQVVANIIDNAVKNSDHQNRKIKFTTKIKQENFEIIIEDNGAGIEPENLERIFEQFVTLPTKYSTKGSGIGLYLCKIIITEHGGEITAHSEGLDRGAKFQITLPRIVYNK